MTNLQINDITWKRTEEDKFFPVLKLWNRETKEFSPLPLNNYLFNFKLSTDKFCTGYTKDGQYVECRFNNKVDKSFSGQCPYCERIQGFKSTFIMGDLSHERSEEILSQEYYIYLGYFEPGILKVGTANTKRSSLRLIEQDCLVYCYIAKGIGYQVQKLEHLISKKFGITENVKSNHKFKYLGIKPNQKHAEEQFESAFSRIKNEYLNTEYSSLFLENIKVKSLLEKNELFFPGKYKKFEDTNLYGNFKGLRGRYLFLENESNTAAFDINYFIGRDIEDYLDKYSYNFLEEQLSLI